MWDNSIGFDPIKTDTFVLLCDDAFNQSSVTLDIPGLYFVTLDRGNELVFVSLEYTPREDLLCTSHFPCLHTHYLQVDPSSSFEVLACYNIMRRGNQAFYSFSFFPSR